MVTLLLGGARSGKSGLAEARLAALPAPRTYVATWETDGADADMRSRVERHRARRPAAWGLVEVGRGGDLGAALGGIEGSVLIDSLTTWVAGADGFAVDLEGLCEALARRRDDTVIVSDEVSLGVHPSSVDGRRFRDALGAVNEAVAAASDEVLLVVAGRALALPPASA